MVGGLASLVPVFLPENRRGLDGAVDRVKGEKGEEGGVGLAFDEGGSVVGEAQREGLALGAVLHLGISERGEEAPGGAAPVVSADVLVKAVVLREGALAPEMPLAGEEGSVATLFEGLGQAGVLVRKMADVFRGQDPVVAFPVQASGGPDPVGDAMAGGIFPGHDAGAGGRAHLAGGIAMGEAYALPCDAIDVRGFVVGAAFNGQVSDPEVISEDENDVGSGGEGGRAGEQEDREKKAHQEGSRLVRLDEEVCGDYPTSQFPNAIRFSSRVRRGGPETG